MGKAKAVDTGALAEVDSELSDIPVYLERLTKLTEEKTYLISVNASSII